MKLRTILALLILTSVVAFGLAARAALDQPTDYQRISAACGRYATRKTGGLGPRAWERAYDGCMIATGWGA